MAPQRLLVRVDISAKSLASRALENLAPAEERPFLLETNQAF
jgi:hypothetical protein